jgi:hypothetical protein
MKITSSAFEHEGKMPSKYTCDGENVSPPLEFVDVPEDAKSLALVMDDPDAPAGTFDHWLTWNIPANAKSIGEGKEPEGVQGTTDFGGKGYGGPCPPSGEHRYFFKLYALDTELDLPEGSSKEDLEKSMEGHIVEQAVLMGKYSR